MEGSAREIHLTYPLSLIEKLKPSSFTRSFTNGGGVLCLYNIVIDKMMEVALSSWKNSGTNIYPNGKPSDLDYADDIVPLSGDPINLQVFVGRPNDSVVAAGMRFTSSKCKLPLQDCIGSKPHFVLAEE